MKATKVWENVTETRLGGEFWACDVIAHKTHFDTDRKYTVQLREKISWISATIKEVPPSNKPRIWDKNNLKNAVTLIRVNMVCEWVMIGSGFTALLQINLKQRFITFEWHSSEYCLTIFFSFVLVIGTQGEHSNHLFTESWVCFSSLLTNWNSL